MNAPRLFCSDLAVGELELDEGESRHALASLRLRPGDQVALFDGAGHFATARLGDVRAQAAKARRGRGIRVLVERVLYLPPPTRWLRIITAASKGPRLSWMIEKATELGVSEIVLAQFARSVVKPEAGAEARLTRTAIEACKQCRRHWLPRISVANDLRSAVARLPELPPGDSSRMAAGAESESAEPAGALIVADPSETAVAISTWLHGRWAALSDLTAVIGPEGGIEPAEIEFLRQRGGHPVRLSEYILRIETAVVSVAANWAARMSAGT